MKHANESNLLKEEIQRTNVFFEIHAETKNTAVMNSHAMDVGALTSV